MAHYEALIKRAAQLGAKLVCFPELALPGFSTHPRIFEVAEQVPGPSTDKLSQIAAATNIYISMGLAEKARGNYYITQALVGPDGYLGKYRKHHPGEQGFSPGQSFPVFSIEGFRVGVNICSDARHQGTLEALARKNVDIILQPHGNILGRGQNADEWTLAKVAYVADRAIRARAYILLNNLAGDVIEPEQTLSFGSGALVLDPMGQVVKRTTQKTRTEKMIVVTLLKPLSLVIPPFEMKRLGIKGK